MILTQRLVSALIMVLTTYLLFIFLVASMGSGLRDWREILVATALVAAFLHGAIMLVRLRNPDNFSSALFFVSAFVLVVLVAPLAKWYL